MNHYVCFRRTYQFGGTLVGHDSEKMENKEEIQFVRCVARSCDRCHILVWLLDREFLITGVRWCNSVIKISRDSTMVM